MLVNCLVGELSCSPFNLEFKYACSILINNPFSATYNLQQLTFSNFPAFSKKIRHDTRDVFYVRRMVDYLKAAKVNAYIMYIFGRLSFYRFMQPIIISKCFTLVISRDKDIPIYRTLEMW